MTGRIRENVKPIVNITRLYVSDQRKTSVIKYSLRYGNVFYEVGLGKTKQPPKMWVVAMWCVRIRNEVCYRSVSKFLCVFYSSDKEMRRWIRDINKAAALLSAAPLCSPVGSQVVFRKALLPSAPSTLPPVRCLILLGGRGLYLYIFLCLYSLR